MYRLRRVPLQASAATILPGEAVRFFSLPDPILLSTYLDDDSEAKQVISGCSFLALRLTFDANICISDIVLLWE